MRDAHARGALVATRHEFRRQRRPSRPARARSERGSATVEFVICAVVMVLLLMVIVQVALWFHTRAVATTAARHGLDEVRVLNGDPAAGEATAREFLDQGAGGLEDRSVSAERSATEASVTVHGTVVSVIPGISLPLTIRVSGPVERIVP